MTRVVNIRHSLYDVYIGRAGHGHDGYFGNPIIIGKYCPECRSVHLTAGSTKPCYKKYFLRRIRVDEEFRERILGLEGLDLGCFCAPNPCHGDVIVEWLDSKR